MARKGRNMLWVKRIRQYSVAIAGVYLIKATYTLRNKMHPTRIKNRRCVYRYPHSWGNRGLALRSRHRIGGHDPVHSIARITQIQQTLTSELESTALFVLSAKQLTRITTTRVTATADRPWFKRSIFATSHNYPFIVRFTSDSMYGNFITNEQVRDQRSTDEVTLVFLSQSHPAPWHCTLYTEQIFVLPATIFLAVVILTNVLNYWLSSLLLLLLLY
jgi:hypothetical protein